MKGNPFKRVLRRLAWFLLIPSIAAGIAGASMDLIGGPLVGASLTMIGMALACFWTSACEGDDA